MSRGSRRRSAGGSKLPARTSDPTQVVGYAALLEEIKGRIRAAQVRASLAVNRELVSLYWQIGREILARQRDAGWGARVVERLAADLHGEFPGMRGLSRTNLLYMRSFAEPTATTQLSNSLLDKSRGATTRCCWTN